MFSIESHRSLDLSLIGFPSDLQVQIFVIFQIFSYPLSYIRRFYHLQIPLSPLSSPSPPSFMRAHKIPKDTERNLRREQKEIEVHIEAEMGDGEVANKGEREKEERDEERREERRERGSISHRTTLSPFLSPSLPSSSTSSPSPSLSLSFRTPHLERRQASSSSLLSPPHSRILSLSTDVTPFENFDGAEREKEKERERERENDTDAGRSKFGKIQRKELSNLLEIDSPTSRYGKIPISVRKVNSSVDWGKPKKGKPQQIPLLELDAIHNDKTD